MVNENKVVFLTGASGGLGNEISKHLYDAGYSLALHYFNHKPSLKEGPRVKHFYADLRQTEDIQTMMHELLAHFPRIDILINNAGVSHNGMSWKLDFKNWADSIAVNLTAPFLISQSCIPAMRENQFGRIINISSVVGQTGFIGTSAYAASKAGLFGLTKTLSKELAHAGITVNSFALGYFNEGMIKDVPEDLKSAIIEQIPLKKLGEVQAITQALDFVLSDNASYFTGQTLNINGGLY